MPRPLIIRDTTHPYHVTARCLNQEFFPHNLVLVWDVMVHQLYRLHQDEGLAIHGFILMGNHFHLLCHTPRRNLDECMHIFLKRVAGILNMNWEGRYRWSLIDNQTYYYQVYRYIFQNPVRAGIVKRVENYFFSTLNRVTLFPIHSTITMSFGGREGEVLWLNERLEQEDEGLIKLGLRKGQFSISQKNLKASKRLRASS
jgi:putative transposase